MAAAPGSSQTERGMGRSRGGEGEGGGGEGERGEGNGEVARSREVTQCSTVWGFGYVA